MHGTGFAAAVRLAAPARPSIMRASPSRTSPTRSSSTRSSSTRTSPARPSPETSPARTSPTRTSPARTSPARPSITRTSSVRSSPARSSSARTSTDANLTALIMNPNLTDAKWPGGAPVPKGWKLDNASGRLTRAGTDSGPTNLPSYRAIPPMGTGRPRRRRAALGAAAVPASRRIRSSSARGVEVTLGAAAIRNAILTARRLPRCWSHEQSAQAFRHAKNASSDELGAAS